MSKKKQTSVSMDKQTAVINEEQTAVSKEEQQTGRRSCQLAAVSMDEQKDVSMED